MSDRGLRVTGMFLPVLGFDLWSYGFIYSSFWYAHADASFLEPVRVWVPGVGGQPVVPGVIEEIVGLAAALLGTTLHVVS